MSGANDEPNNPSRAPHTNDWDPGPVADQKLINALRPKLAQGTSALHDPLEEKHKAQAYRSDFRTVDYRKLSRPDDERASERERIKAMHSSWVPSSTPSRSGPPACTGTFGSFGGTPIRAEIIRLERGDGTPSAPHGTAAMTDEPPKAAAPLDRATPAVRPAGAQSGGGIHDGDAPELLTGPRDGTDSDPLTRIDGIGPSIERLLYDLGVFHFEQIAGWTEVEARWIETTLTCESGRIARENWISQAKRLRTS